MSNRENVSTDYLDTYTTEYMIKTNKMSVMWSGGLTIGCIIMFTITLLFGATSWIKIRQWRQFKNYVFMNIILALFLVDVAYAGCFMNWPCCGHILGLTYRIAMSAFANWVLIMCMVIYTKILKVFSGNLQHKYLKANAFAWGMAAIECALPLQIGSSVNATIYVVHAMTYVIIGFYLSIMYALLKLTTIRMVSTENTTQICKIFVYVTSAFGILMLMQALYYFPEFYEYIFIGIGVCETILSLSYLSMKSHWDIWGDYIKGKIDVSYQDEIRNC